MERRAEGGFGSELSVQVQSRISGAGVCLKKEARKNVASFVVARQGVTEKKLTESARVQTGNNSGAVRAGLVLDVKEAELACT